MKEVPGFIANLLGRKGMRRGIQLQFSSLKNTEGGLFCPEGSWNGEKVEAE